MDHSRHGFQKGLEAAGSHLRWSIEELQVIQWLSDVE